MDEDIHRMIGKYLEAGQGEIQGKGEEPDVTGSGGRDKVHGVMKPEVVHDRVVVIEDKRGTEDVLIQQQGHTSSDEQEKQGLLHAGYLHGIDYATGIGEKCRIGSGFREFGIVLDLEESALHVDAG